jgi:hypothetical protein
MKLREGLRGPAIYNVMARTTIQKYIHEINLPQ